MSYRNNGTSTNRLELTVADAPWRITTPPVSTAGATIMLWVKMEVDRDASTVMFYWGDTSIRVGCEANETGTLLIVWQGDAETDSSFNLSVAEWVHLTMMFDHQDDGNPTLYINGELELSTATDVNVTIPNTAIYLIGHPTESGALNGLGAEFKYWPRVLAGGAEAVRQEMYAKGPLHYPELCAYFPLDNKHRLQDGQGWGMKLASVGCVFDPEHPPGLLPAQFMPWDFLPGAPAVGGASVYEQVAFRFRNDDGSLGMPP